MKLKTIIVDDELPSLQNLEQKIREFCPDLEIIATIQKPELAAQIINSQKFDLLFLDIEMPRINGFKLLELITDRQFDIVFTTAYNHYAIDAIRISAFDYLLKPIGVSELQATINRLIENKSGSTQQRLDVLRKSLSGNLSQEDRISINTTEGIEFYQIKEIVYIESSSNYSKLHLENGKVLLVTRLLKEFDELLTPYSFFRVHHSYLINLNHLKKYIKGDGGQVVLSNGDTLDVSRRRKDEFIKALN
ncbi:MAG TPA: LytTR family DNA-binding domain-containing protein [Ginsengibacter sp.]|nr:LytTR family DNA-binding domain-containing protein [Chitinophagaceae bacterium]HRN72972.1 LytTR family DNA-binding domain-containing protein [Ginsengibacter sp.]HRP17848.1 LytTR family DNA-binding domain-containing protein [Ginsengibacter sp.]HRP44239.1 LytTR family DNA-binding domain-containing protein [Ginsengibacter sp.]